MQVPLPIALSEPACTRWRGAQPAQCGGWGGTHACMLGGVAGARAGLAPLPSCPPPRYGTVPPPCAPAPRGAEVSPRWSLSSACVLLSPCLASQQPEWCGAAAAGLQRAESGAVPAQPPLAPCPACETPQRGRPVSRPPNTSTSWAASLGSLAPQVAGNVHLRICACRLPHMHAVCTCSNMPLHPARLCKEAGGGRSATAAVGRHEHKQPSFSIHAATS